MSAPAPRRSGGFDAVLFDFGGVVATSPFTAMRAMAEAAGLDPDEVLALLLGPYDEDTDHPWHRIERGEIALEEFGRWLAEETAARGWQLPRPSGVFAAMTVQDTVVATIRSLRDQGYKTALVTNNLAEASESWRSMVPLDELFDIVVDSSEVGARKPSPRIYELALDQLGVAPERAVFLDDAPGNVAGAERVGMAGVLVGDDPAAALAELEALLGDRIEPPGE